MGRIETKPWVNDAAIGCMEYAQSALNYPFPLSMLDGWDPFVQIIKKAQKEFECERCGELLRQQLGFCHKCGKQLCMRD